MEIKMAGFKTLFLNVGILFISVQAVPAPGHSFLKGYCNTSKHCKKNECCVSFNTVKGKRDVGPISEDIRKFVDGKCEKLGRNKDKCFVEPPSPGSGLFYERCPCRGELNCKGNGIITKPLGETGTCEERERECSTPKDCRRNECCVNKFRGRGKRAADSVDLPGFCKPMGTNDSPCLVVNGSGRPKDLVFLHCPCFNLFTCRGTGVRDFPHGELGVCGLRSYNRKG